MLLSLYAFKYLHYSVILLSRGWNKFFGVCSDLDLDDLEVIDHSIIWLITGAQAKVPVEMLYLETALLPVKSVISVEDFPTYTQF